jgi:cephalosporin hydroxylase
VRPTCGTVLSVDVEDCATSNADASWHFVRADDVLFAATFPSWARELGLKPTIDVLFIDTSHLYDHTRAELQAWTPFLGSSGKVILHDTNLKKWNRRRDGSMGGGWDNQRGVIRAVEEFLGVQLDETREHVFANRGWLVRHYPECSGLTVLRRIAPAMK